MEVCITLAELEKALAALRDAKAHGLKHSLACLQLVQGGRRVDECLVAFNGVILRASATDPSKNWGRGNPADVAYRRGKLVEIYP